MATQDDYSVKLEEIKEEMIGGKGLIKNLKTEFMPDTQRMAHLAQNKFEEDCTQSQNPDFILSNLLTIEYKLYLQKEREFRTKFFEYANLVATSSDYPIIRGVIDDFLKAAKTTSSHINILAGIVAVSTALAESNMQSRKSRAGSSLMHHIDYLLQKSGFRRDIDYRREYKIENCKLDFFFPNLEKFIEDPGNCCAVACQTTSNDRFRLSFGQVPKTTHNRACTAIGTDNFGKYLGPSSLTADKLQEAKENGIKFVIINSAINSEIRKSEAVISYQEWIEELKNLRQSWG
jgi:hypothetical protein